jgi:hypothetical protein
MRLEMYVCSGAGFKGKISPRPRSRVWLVCMTDYKTKSKYPSNEKILIIAGQHLPLSYGLEILQRSDIHHEILVRLRIGTDRKKRAAFLEALGKATR